MLRTAFIIVYSYQTQLSSNQGEKSLSQGSIFAVTIFSFHVVNHKYFSICEELHSGAICENLTALINVAFSIRCFAATHKKKIEAGAAAFYPYTRKNCKHTFLPSWQESDRPQSVFVPKQNVSQSSTEVTESQSTSPTSGDKMFCDIC